MSSTIIHSDHTPSNNILAISLLEVTFEVGIRDVNSALYRVKYQVSHIGWCGEFSESITENWFSETSYLHIRL